MSVVMPDESEGLITRVCAITDTGLQICDVWRSQAEHFQFNR